MRKLAEKGRIPVGINRQALGLDKSCKKTLILTSVVISPLEYYSRRKWEIAKTVVNELEVVQV